ncbi:MAG TPA: isoprenylcysteine carboxylmethyltransferase family protein [Bryobacteraceae bacterium]|nr:isoprenylcysteine carboxylmethyltransferase family protein [Bryobacteraceae bacterium]
MKWYTGRHLSRWTGIAIQMVLFPAIHGLVPWALSLPGARHGWVGGRPGVANLVGLIPVAAGFYTYVLCTREHFLAAPEGWLLERTPHYPTPAYLLTGGPYRYSCNPIYLAELVIWLGWMAFYGSWILVGTFVVMAVVMGPIIVPREERGLEARFGEVYREFRRTTPRWLGRRRR